MAGNYKFPMDQKGTAKLLTTTVDSFVRDRLINREERSRHKEQCADRLAAEGRSLGESSPEISYSDQAVLANLDWGIEALEEAISTPHAETKLARLDHSEKMLQVCAMLTSDQKTAGVPNFYLSAWAHLNLAYLWKLRNNVSNSVKHILEMFSIDPFFSRVDFAPELWRDLFLPNMGSIIGWYSEERHRLFMGSSDFSFSVDFDRLFDESLIVGPDKVEKLRELERVFGDSLDESTRLYAKYFVDCLSFESNPERRVVPMMPIAEPPMTPTRELSRSIPDFVKFGPILPKSAGFSKFESNRDTNPKNMELAIFDPQEALPEEYEHESDDSNVDFDEKARKLDSPSSSKAIVTKEEEYARRTVKSFSEKSISHSPTVFSPLCSPKTSPKSVSPLKQEGHDRSGHITLLRLKSIRFTDSATATSSPISPSMSHAYTDSSVDSDGEEILQSRGQTPRSCETFNSHSSKKSLLNDDNISLPSSENMSSKLRPPKDFVCPITGQIFCDPVTLETGQTYERKAINEWLKRGNTTCPITRQPLSATTLPKTNYILKRLITSWREKIPESPRESQSPEASLDKVSHLSRAFTTGKNKRFLQAAVSSSPTSVISQAEAEKIINALKPHLKCLCTSEDLRACETSVLEIARLLKNSKGDPGVHSVLSDPTVVNSFAEILSASLNKDILRTSIYVLSELISIDESVGEVLTSVDSDLDCLAALLETGLTEAAILICQLRPAFGQVSGHNLVPSLVQILLSEDDDSGNLQFVMDPKDAAIYMLEQILVGGDENNVSVTVLSLISENGIHALVKLLDRVKGRKSIVSILMCCMKVESSCRALIADKIKVSYVLELFHSGNDSVRCVCVGFLSELVKLSRKTLSNQILHKIKEEGTFSSMHAFVSYLQMAPMELQSALASLLLQLDLLVEPRKMSIYREEAIEALIEALRRNQFSNSQFMAIDALSALIGPINSSGDSYTDLWLLKLSGFDQPFSALMKSEQQRNRGSTLMEAMEEEEKALSCWEKRLAFVLCNHESGSIFEALEECLKSTSLEMAKQCLVIATWLVHMLPKLPDTGVKITARKCLLDEFINILLSSKSQDEKILVTLALKTFIKDEDAAVVIGAHAKCIYKILRKMKRNSVVVGDVMKTLMNLSSSDPTELWSCTELVELDLTSSGEVLTLIHLRGRVLSGHSDGTIKVWDTGKRVPRLIQEAHEHSKAVTCLFASASGDKLYSGSLDKTIRVWAVKPEEIHCVQVHNVKEPVHDLTANSKIACFISQGTGVKIYDWRGTTKHINFNKYVKCQAMHGTKLYCGCPGFSIQEIDLCTYASSLFYSGTRKLLGKQTIHSLKIHEGLLFAGGSSVDSTAGKIFLLSTKEAIGSFQTGIDIHEISINSDFIFTATKCGVIEVWLKERFTKVSSIKMSSGHSKITSLASDPDGRSLYAGTSDGKIQVWDLD